MIKTASKLIVGASLISSVAAECPNACSSHGRCSSYDMCLCYRNWMANDCSERVCQFGLAHVDTPKGDLDATSSVTGPGSNVITNSEMYPYGTSEQFPQITDSSGTVQTNTGHYYMECSNKGICDREAGNCECFPGYEGSACQRASCPAGENGVCSGHGVCQSIRELAMADNDNIYELWDDDTTLGCDCDAGYYGADCSLRKCKYGIDPLYVDDMMATPRVANWTFGIYDMGGIYNEMTGNYSIVFYDVHGENWETEALQANAECDDITAALEALPNDVIPGDSVLCLRTDNDIGGNKNYVATTDNPNNFDGDGPLLFDFNLYKQFILVFPGNPGILKQIEINRNLDGVRPTLVTNATADTLASYVYADGFHGEEIAYVPNLCEEVDVKIGLASGTDNWELILDSDADAKLLRACLGDGNNDATDNVFSENFDQGDNANPHLVKLVQQGDRLYSKICNKTSGFIHEYHDEVDDALHPASGVIDEFCLNLQPAGFYAPLINDGSISVTAMGTWPIYGNQGADYARDVYFHIFTTEGVLTKISNDNANQDVLAMGSYFSNVITSTTNHDSVTMSLDCETRSDATATNCLNKNDRIMIFSTSGGNDFKYPNIYNIEKISTPFVNGETGARHTEIVLDMGINTNTLTNMDIYRFDPPTGKSAWGTNWGQSYARECSDRGICDAETGLCNCFGGYTGDDCSIQSTLAQ